MSQEVKRNRQCKFFSQLIECNVKNIYFEKSYTECGGETRLRRFSKKSKLIIFLDQHSELLYSSRLLFVKSRTIEFY